MWRFHNFMKIFSSVDTSSNSSMSFSDRPTLHSSSISSAERFTKEAQRRVLHYQKK